MKNRLPLALSAMLLVGLAACDRSPQPAPEPETYNEPAAEAPLPEPEPAPLPAPAPVEPTNVVAEPVAEAPPPPEPTPPSEQMLEDAEATGMTARVAREDGDLSESSGTPANEAKH